MEEQIENGARGLYLEMYFEDDECEKEIGRKMIDDKIFVKMKKL